MKPSAGLGYSSVRCINMPAPRQILPAAYSGQALDGFTAPAGGHLGWGARRDRGAGQ